jgi:general secretion pathway protein E/type IV pilus assembly protein PilB
MLAMLALHKGFRPLADEAIARVVEGSTTIAEVSRAVDLTGRYA